MVALVETRGTAAMEAENSALTVMIEASLKSVTCFIQVCYSHHFLILSGQIETSLPTGGRSMLAATKYQHKAGNLMKSFKWHRR